MKTQIENLRSGKMNQLLNPNIDYTNLPQSSSHKSHCGSSFDIVSKTWASIIVENPTHMYILINDIYIKLTANWSESRKSVSYVGSLSKNQLEKFGLNPALNKEPYVVIDDANSIKVSNGKNESVHICPSLVKIIG